MRNKIEFTILLPMHQRAPWLATKFSQIQQKLNLKIVLKEQEKELVRCRQ